MGDHNLVVTEYPAGYWTVRTTNGHELASIMLDRFIPHPGRIAHALADLIADDLVESAI